MSCRISSGVFGRPLRGLDFQRQYARKPARCQRITVSGLTIFKASSTPGASRYNPANRFTSQHVELMTKRQYLYLQRRSRPEQSDQRQPNQAANISHQPRASPNSTPLASRIEFPTMTGDPKSTFVLFGYPTSLRNVDYHSTSIAVKQIVTSAKYRSASCAASVHSIEMIRTGDYGSDGLSGGPVFHLGQDAQGFYC